MLVLSRKANESVVIDLGDHLVVMSILAISQNKVKLGFVGPKEVSINRLEIAQHLFKKDTTNV